MKTRAIQVGKYMTAEPLVEKPRQIYTIRSRDGTVLGHVDWYPPWRCYVFSPDDEIVLSHDCCTAMAKFLREIGKEERHE